MESHRECQELMNRLAATDEPAIVAAASSMCEEERIINYLKALLPDERNDVLFAGYRAQGTLGREIQSGSHTVNIDNQPIEANAQLHTISGYSAHADQSDLLKYVTGIQTQPKAVHLIHGEKEAK